MICPAVAHIDQCCSLQQTRLEATGSRLGRGQIVAVKNRETHVCAMELFGFLTPYSIST